MIITCLLTVACSYRVTEDQWPCNEAITQPNGKPSVLIIGDSISMGYTPHVQAFLPQYEIVHNLCNARDTRNGVKRVDQWIKQRNHWEIIVWNQGIWDFTTWNRTSLNDYKNNLRYIGAQLKATNSKVMWVSTTHIPENAINNADAREPGDEIIYNQAAADVMAELNIPTYDLNGVSNTIIEYHLNPHLKNDVHFNDMGYDILGNYIASYIETEIQ